MHDREKAGSLVPVLLDRLEIVINPLDPGIAGHEGAGRIGREKNVNLARQQQILKGFAVPDRGDAQVWRRVKCQAFMPDAFVQRPGVPMHPSCCDAVIAGHDAPHPQRCGHLVLGHPHCAAGKICRGLDAAVGAAVKPVVPKGATDEGGDGDIVRGAPAT